MRLWWALMFLTITLASGLVGLPSVGGKAAGIAQLLFFTFLVLLIVSLLAGDWNRRIRF